MITRKDVAELAGGSKTTVTRVLSGNGYVSEENRRKVKNAAERLNYIPNNIAKNLNQQYSNIIAVLVEDLTNQYYLQIISAMTDEAMKLGMMVSVFSITRKNIDTVIGNLIAERVCGIVNLALYSCDKKYIEILKSLDIFLVNLEGGNSLILDYEPGIVEVFEHLKSKGKNRIAYFAGLSKEFSAGDSRYQSYLKCVAGYGFVQDPNFIVFGNYPEENAFGVGRNSVKKLYALGKKPDAILCLNDVLAIGVLHELWEMGIRVPEEVSVIGCDNIVMSAYTTPPLASLDIEKEKQGRVFVESTVTRDKQKKYVFSARLIKRGSLL